VLAAASYLAFSGSAAGGQGFDATSLHEPASPAKGWLIHAGDDPAYARADFDDSQWMTVDVSSDSPHETLHGAQPSVVWYRLHVKVSPTDRDFAVEEWNLSHAFEIYANGKPLLKTGSFSPYVPYTYSARLIGRIPDEEVASGSVVLAVRVYLSKSDWSGPFPGLYYSNIVLGQEHELRQSVWLMLVGGNAARWMNSLFGLGLGLVALTLFFAQPERREYLWIFLAMLATTAASCWQLFDVTHSIPIGWEMAATPLYAAEAIFIILLYFAFLRLKVGRWMWICIATAGLIELAGYVGLYLLHVAPTGLLIASELPMEILMSGVIPILLLVQWRKGNKEAGILLIPALLSSLAGYVSFTFAFLALLPGSFRRYDRAYLFVFAHPFGPFTVSIYAVGDLLFNLSLTAIVVLRATKTSREQALLEGELAAARGVQQVIVPEHVESVPGFTVESAYLPAEQVGGDFFQVLPVKDGGLLVVVGDVAGKGLPAAMLVSVMVGAIRGVAAFTSDPAELLENLNERLVGRVHGGFATALVARIEADGRVAIANAGHPSPYLDGVELALPGALPLGIESGARYEVLHDSIPSGGRLTFYSDGVIEAMDAKGEMLGFERAQAISTERADEILKKALGFGQQDDITVITIDRTLEIAAAA
jgi:hypothetical protein